MEHEHDGTHPDCGPCFTIKIKSLNWQGTAAASRRSEDKTFSDDMAAYQRLRRNGVQPRHIGGSAELESQAMEKVEIEKGVIMSDPMRKQFMPRLKEAGIAK